VSGSPSPDRRDAEISIDLGAADAPPAPAEPPPPRPRRPVPGLLAGRENMLLAYAAIVIALAAAAVTVVKLSPLNRPLAEETVTAYLEAVHDGDVDEALSYTNITEPAGGFLRPEALDDSWRIVTVAQVDYADDRNSGGAVAQVYAEIEADNGVRAGFRYRVGIEHGRAEIENALAAAGAFVAFDHLAINGVTVPVDEGRGSVEVILLPGVYRFYPDLPTTLAPQEDAGMLALGTEFTYFGSGYTDSWLTVPWMEPTEAGMTAINTAVREHFDACAADPSLDACPFAFPPDPGREVALAPGATWEITAYPQGRTWPWWYEQAQGFALATTVPGEARAQVRIAEGGQERTTTVSCPIWVEGLLVDLDFRGGATIGHTLEGADEQCRSLVEVG
jgi:hypothetical protein